MEFREDSIDKGPITAEPEEPLFEAIVDGRIEIANVSLNRGVHNDRNIVARIFRLICGTPEPVLSQGQFSRRIQGV
jgi:hypothetical protein